MKNIKGELLIIGDGTEKIKLRQLTKKLNLNKKVKFLGFQKNPEKYLQQSSVFVLASDYEGFGHVFLEAMASGLPCIAFKPNQKKIITASNEIIQDNKTGFLVKNEKEMIEKINLLLENKSLRNKIGKQARKQVEKYSWKKTAQKILKFANSIS